MANDFYRFRQIEVERISALKGTNSWYSITDAQDVLLYECHVIGSRLGGTSTFHASRDQNEVLFRLEPKRRFLNLTYYVCEGETGPRLATLELFKSRGMKVCGTDGREQYRIVDPQGRLDRFMQTVFDGVCSEYALVSDDETIGRLGRRERTDEEPVGRRGLLGRFLKGLAKALSRDWCLELEDEGKAIEDHRPLLAGMILLLVQTIAFDQAT